MIAWSSDIVNLFSGLIGFCYSPLTFKLDYNHSCMERDEMSAHEACKALSMHEEFKHCIFVLYANIPVFLKCSLPGYINTFKSKPCHAKFRAMSMLRDMTIF